MTPNRLRLWTVTALAVAGTAGAVLLGTPANAQITAPDNPAIQYAYQAWNWTDQWGSATVPAGGTQEDFGCAEFVSRALAAEGLVPGLNQYSARTGPGSFEQYVYNGKTYNLLNVGSTNWVGPLPMGYTTGLWDYLMDSRIGTEIGMNTAAAYPGDIAFWFYDGPVSNAQRHHAAMLVKTGATTAQTLYNAHNYARREQPLSADDEVKTIVRINKIKLKPQTAVVESGTSACPGSQQYFSATDAYGVPIFWTYANGTHACVRVTYTPRTTSTTCNFRFYVPAGYATAHLILGYRTSDGVMHYSNLDEYQIEGWHSAFAAANVTSILFSDNDNDAYPRQIGWGSDYAHGISQEC